MESCINQQPTNIAFNWKIHLKFQVHYIKVPVPIRVYGVFECFNQPTKNPKVIYKQILTEVVFYLITLHPEITITHTSTKVVPEGSNVV